MKRREYNINAKLNRPKLSWKKQLKNELGSFFTSKMFIFIIVLSIIVYFMLDKITELGVENIKGIGYLNTILQMVGYNLNNEPLRANNKQKKTTKNNDISMITENYEYECRQLNILVKLKKKRKGREKIVRPAWCYFVDDPLRTPLSTVVQKNHEETRI
eukprot:UN23295